MHNMEIPNQIVPEIIKLLEPKSVVDFGCGVEIFLKAFKNHGINNVLGIDRDWVDKEIYSISIFLKMNLMHVILKKKLFLKRNMIWQLVWK